MKKISLTVVIVELFFQILEFEKYLTFFCQINLYYVFINIIGFIYRIIVDTVVEYFVHRVCLEL